MGANEKEPLEAKYAGAPQAWVWSRYKGEIPQLEGEHGSAADEDPMLYEEKGLHPFATALGLAIAVGIVLGLAWFFTSLP